MRRREFIAALGSAPAAWPLAALAQQAARTRRVGVLSSLAETDVEAQAWDAAFRKRLVELGWVDGRSVRIDYRWGAGSVDRMRLFARELVQQKPGRTRHHKHSSDRGVAGRDSYNSDCICVGVRSGWQRICLEPGTSRRQHHWLPKY